MPSLNNKFASTRHVEMPEPRGRKEFTCDALFRPMLSTNPAARPVSYFGERCAAIEHPCRGALAGSDDRVRAWLIEVGWLREVSETVPLTALFCDGKVEVRFITSSKDAALRVWRLSHKRPTHVG